jgi:hypothetical protein
VRHAICPCLFGVTNQAKLDAARAEVPVHEPKINKLQKKLDGMSAAGQLKLVFDLRYHKEVCGRAKIAKLNAKQGNSRTLVVDLDARVPSIATGKSKQHKLKCLQYENVRHIPHSEKCAVLKGMEAYGSDAEASSDTGSDKEQAEQDAHMSELQHPAQGLQGHLEEYLEAAAACPDDDEDGHDSDGHEEGDGATTTVPVSGYTRVVHGEPVDVRPHNRVVTTTGAE